MSAWLGRKLPWLVAGVSVTMMLLGMALSLVFMLQTGSGRPLLSHQGFLQISTLLYAAVGALITSRQPRNIIGWLILTTGLIAGLNTISVGYSVFQPLGVVDGLPSSAWAKWIGNWIWLPASAFPTLFVFLHFPHGRLPSRRWRPIAWLAALGLAGSIFGFAFHPDTLESSGFANSNPFGIPEARAALESAYSLGLAVMIIIGLIGSFLAVGLRFRRSRGVEREQMKWLVFAVGLSFLAAILGNAAPVLFPLNEDLAHEISFIVTGLMIVGIATAVGIAILRHQLYDIDLVINRTLVYGALTAAVIAVYFLVVGGLGLLFRAQDSLGLSLLGVGIVALVVQPTRDRLQHGVNHLMYGDRDDPYAALSRLGRRLEGTLAPEAVLAIIVETVAQTLKLPYAAISLTLPTDLPGAEDEVPVVTALGTPTGDVLRLPLTYQGEGVGALLAGSRVGENFSPADQRLLADLARQAGVAVHAVRLTMDLQRSRERLVTTREEERRRLRRDLHDGLGSQLAALHLRLDTLRTLIPDGAAAAQGLVEELRDEVYEAIADIRRLVYELRPPALDELGLAGALQQLASQSTSNNGLRVAIDAPPSLPPLPAAVEVAAYRIAQEALTNVVRHAQARNCQIRLTLPEELRLEVEDDGVGLPAKPQANVGLRSMRERAAELGGTFEAGNSPAGGTRIRVRLPLPAGRE